jgi:tetratricopeptide (TPR) repeat protein
LDQKLREHESNARLAAVLFQMRGTVLFSQKEYKKSEADFKKALELAPDLAAPYFSLARLYQVTGETEKAISQYQDILDRQPRFIQAYMALGVIYDSVGKKTEARTMYEKVLEINPDFAPAANNLAWLLLEQDESPGRALDLAKKAKARLPDDPNVADTLGWALIRAGLYTSALAELNQAAAKLPENPTILYHLGLAHWKMGERDKAMKVLQEALKTKSDFPEKKEAEKLLEEIMTERG